MRALALAGALALATFGCAASTSKAPATKSANTSRRDQPARIPRALQRGGAVARLLQRLPARHGSWGVIASNLSRPLAYWEGMRMAFAATPTGRALLPMAEARIRHPIDGRSLRALLDTWGFAVDKPQGVLSGRGQRQLLILSLRDAATFRLAVAAEASRITPARWTEQRVGKRSIWQFLSGQHQLWECAFAADGPSFCAWRTLGPFKDLLDGKVESSVWSRLDAKTRARLERGHKSDLFGWLLIAQQVATADANLRDDALSIALDVAGPGIGAATAALGSWPSGALYGRYRALSGERFYLRLPRRLVTRVMRTPFTSGWPSGELLLVSSGRCALPSLLLGSDRPQLLAKMIQTVPALMQRLRAKVTFTPRTVGGHPALEVSGLPAKLSLILPKSIGLAATPNGLVVAPWSCVSEAVATATRAFKAPPPPSAGLPVAAGQLALGDPFVALWPIITQRSGGQLPPKIAQAFSVARVLASQLHDVRGTVMLARAAVQGRFIVRLRHRGAKDDAARALWHRAVAARTLGQNATFKQIAAEIAKRAPASRYAQAGKVRPVMLALLGGVMASIAIPAFIKYQRKAKTVEATESLDKLRVGARLYYRADHYSKRGKLLPKQFPRGQTGWTPKQICCKQPGGKCPADRKVWRKDPWRALNFEISEAHRYQYRYRASGSGKKSTFVIEARGDLDCDGVFSNYKLQGDIDPQIGVRSVGPIIVNEIE
ncbi:MAG: hypothetical protein KC503_43170 [Myxococcales bacterium]|nr:hypothetical protein [Myxococcales bacterium]